MINAMVSMNGLQVKLDMIADNMANANTAGYKRKQGSFEDLLTTLKQQPQGFAQPGRLTPLGLNQGWGSRLVAARTDFAQGSLQQTDQPYDVALTGDALFEVMTDGAGGRAYTRDGAFQTVLDGEGNRILTTQNGYPVSAANGTRIVIPAAERSVRIERDGRVVGLSDGGAETQLGRIAVVRAIKPELLEQTADNLFAVPAGMNRTDVVEDVVPDAGNGIALKQGFIEQSNVNMTDEMTELMSVQRAYQLSARALTSSDTMMGLANNLRA